MYLERREEALGKGNQRQRAEAVGLRPPPVRALWPALLFCVSLPLLFSFLFVAPANLVQAADSLSSYLRQEGTQLDLRGTEVTDDDLAELGDPAFSKVVSVLLARTNVGDRGLRNLQNLRLKELDLYLTPVTDKGLEHLRDLPIERLNLTGTVVGDLGLEHLKNMPLALLVLRQTGISDAGLDTLRDLPVKYLDLAKTGITDDGLIPLRNLSKVKGLDLSDTAITDQGLNHLIHIPKLSEVYLAGTQVTEAGLARFKAVRPDVRVNADRPVR